MTATGITIWFPANKPGPKVIQIGTEGGFLPAPVVLNDPPLPIGFYQNPSRPNDPKNGNANRYNLLLAPAERADLIIDFSDVPDGASIVLYNDATAPFPGGDIRYDYYGGGPDLTCIGGAATPSPGYGPDTRVIMRFDVKGTHTRELTFDQTLATLKAALPVTFLATQGPLPSALGVRAKQKTLNEDFDSYGRLRQTLGVAPGGTDFLGPITEFAQQGRSPDVEDLQPDRRHTPHALPLGQRPGLEARGLEVYGSRMGRRSPFSRSPRSRAAHGHPTRTNEASKRP